MYPYDYYPVPRGPHDPAFWAEVAARSGYPPPGRVAGPTPPVYIITEEPPPYTGQHRLPPAGGYAAPYAVMPYHVPPPAYCYSAGQRGGYRAPASARWGTATVPYIAASCILFALMAAAILSANPVVKSGAPPAARRAATHQAASGPTGVSQSLARINQLDPAQYSSDQEYNTWAYATCSAASMTEIINAYDAYYHRGKQYRITDILQVESGIGAISSDLGLLEPTGIDRTVAHYHFKVTWLKKPSLDDVINTGNSGRPVIVNLPPDRWSGGHLLVVRGGNRDYVFLADSSRLNMQAMARQTFMKYWAGFAAVPEPTA